MYFSLDNNTESSSFCIQENIPYGPDTLLKGTLIVPAVSSVITNMKQFFFFSTQAEGHDLQSTLSISFNHLQLKELLEEYFIFSYGHLLQFTCTHQ